MNETKFTPGPWMPPASHKDLTVWATKNDRTEMIASSNTNQWCKEDEANANARLIAAAPDMFDAIKKALEIKQLWFPTGDYTVEHEGEAQALQSMFNALEAAINKATS